ncbi:MAG: AAA family ATPase [Gracilibacteraceae bacterium]|jgi:CO dehydrogenase maturation factor|nr:AAA family ATPase [Gracilibacteraceae bacterium]
MTYTIAVAGKGGVGKTTLCGLLIDTLRSQGGGPILAVDADASANLNEVLGVAAPLTLGSVREDIKTAGSTDKIPTAMTRQDYLDAKFLDALTEEKDYDLLVMGRTQGAGCYCFVNGLLSAYLQKYARNYRFVVVDNEAGMEHLSRGILPRVDMLFIVSDCSRRGIQAAGNIRDLVRELGIRPGAVRFLINKAPPGPLDAGIREEIERQGLELACAVPRDDLIYAYDSAGKPTAALPAESPARQALTALFREALPL